MSINLTENKKHLITKRDGREEGFDPLKLRKVVDWATGGNSYMTKDLIDKIHIRINDRMKIKVLYDEVIHTAASKISALYPQWDTVASNLLLLKIYKESYNLKRVGKYPNFQGVILGAVCDSKIYSKEVFQGGYTLSEIRALDSYLDPYKDLYFTYKSLDLFYNKYCMRDIYGIRVELPQHVYMRIAMWDFYEDDSRLDRVLRFYDYLSDHDLTMATPHTLNAGSLNPQIGSCVLSTVGDSTASISSTDANIAAYSKHSGGIAIDVSDLRAKGARVIGNRGFSGGVIPFIKKFESTISSFDQGGSRKGAGVITFPFWHLEVLDILPLKDAGGTEDTRARKLMYAMRIHNLLKNRVLKDQDITLFDPVEVPDLLRAYGRKFERIYEKYENTAGLRTKVVKARSLWYKFLKYRQQTGNVYCTFIDNINLQNQTNRFVGSSNLCTEITIPSRPSIAISTELDDSPGLDPLTIHLEDTGEIGLCNLASVNLLHYYKKTPEDRYLMISDLARAMDNAIDNQFYPVVDAEYSNKRNRPIGIGVLNYVSMLAHLKLKITDDSVLKVTHEIFEDLYYNLYKASNELARERGAFKSFNETLWKYGVLTIDKTLLPKDSELNFPYLRDWDKLRTDIKEDGVRFSLHAAIAPTATSGKAINATESIEPVHNLFYVEEGTASMPTLANNLKEHREYYVNAFDVPNRRLLELAAIRQKFIDQSQSINLYYKKPNSAVELTEDIFYAMDLGLKTLYYMKTPKTALDTKICDSCT